MRSKIVRWLALEQLLVALQRFFGGQLFVVAALLARFAGEAFYDSGRRFCLKTVHGGALPFSATRLSFCCSAPHNRCTHLELRTVNIAVLACVKHGEQASHNVYCAAVLLSSTQSL